MFCLREKFTFQLKRINRRNQKIKTKVIVEIKRRNNEKNERKLWMDKVLNHTITQNEQKEKTTK